MSKGNMIVWAKAQGEPDETTEIVIRGALEGKRLRKIATENEWPYLPFMTWMEADTVLTKRYWDTLALWADDLAHEALEIADKTELGTITKTKGSEIEVTEQDMLGHRKLQVDTRLKLAARLNRARYGETPVLNLTAGAGSIISILAGLPPVEAPEEIDVTPDDGKLDSQ